jgi:trehalose 6-phosphate synthase/phosphatase
VDEKNPVPKKAAGKRPDTDERRILVASNRLPFTFARTATGVERRRSPGGLVAAVEPVLRKRGGTWIGWPGGESHPDKLESDGDQYRVAAVAMTETEVARYYHGFSNRTLWPLLHSMTDRARFDRRDWETYVKINGRFGEVAVRESDGSEIIWIHDYHLLLAPAAIRHARPDARLSFFLHTPFPPYDIFRLLPWDRELLRGMLACDLIGFHVRGYARNFLDCVERSLGARIHHDEMLVEYGDRTTQIEAHPIGIEFGEFEQLAIDAPEPAQPQPGQVVLGVDRLDYTKGIPERFQAFERLLELHPEHREHVTLLQLAVPSRSQVTEYRELKREIDEMVGRINGRFATSNWSPIRYLYRSVTRKRLAALYRDADVALVTPLRDGMNLVAKEFVACQVSSPGVLVLSKLAGAANTMREVLRVNPYDIDGTAEGLHRALTMGDPERRTRMTALRHRERRDDLEHWVTGFLSAASGSRRSLVPLGDSDFEAWLADFLGRRYRLALFLDYDGTLTPLTDHPSKAKLSKKMRSALETCAARDDTDIAIVSGRAIGDVKAMVKRPNLTYAGNHGLEIVGADMPDFIHEDLVHYRERCDELCVSLEKLAVGGAWIEAKGPTLTYHYRAVAENERDKLIEEARSIIQSAGYQDRDAHCAVEARPPIGWDKGRAVLHILRTRYGPAWSESVRVVYVGDDQTDEDAFRFLAGLATTFRVGSPDTSTAATRRLPDVNAVQSLLDWLSRRTASDPNILESDAAVKRLDSTEKT